MIFTTSESLANQSFVRRYFSHVDPIGKQILEGHDAQKNFYRIVGVTGDARRESPDIPPEPEVLFPLGQIGPDALELAIRTGLANPLVITPDVIRVARQLDPGHTIVGSS